MKIAVRRIYFLVLFIVWIVSFCSILIGKQTGSIIVDDTSSGVPTLLNKYSEIEGCEKFDRVVERTLRKWNLKGVSVAVMRDNKLVYAKGYGYADLENSIECEPYNQFRIASMSKLITAVAIMKLVDEGKLSLSDKVFADGGILYDDFSEYRDRRAASITVEHLLRHEGGFTMPVGDPMFNITLVEKGIGAERPVTAENTINYVLSRQLGFRPGTSRKYSNVGYLMLSQVVEAVSGSDYETFVKRHVLIPAGCTNTHIAENFYSDKHPKEVKYYSDSKDDMVEAFDGSEDMLPKVYGGNDVKGLKGAGGWVSTTADMLRLAMAIDGRNGRGDMKDILSAKSVGVLQTYKHGHMPIGWMNVRGGVFERTGSFSGTSTIMQHSPDGYSWIVLSNTSSWVGFRLNNTFKQMMKEAIRQLPPMSDDRDLFDRDYLSE